MLSCFLKLGSKGTETFLQVKDSFQQTVLGKVDTHMQKNKVAPLPSTKYKNYLKWIKGQNLRPKTMKFLEENTGQIFMTVALEMTSWI